MASTTTLLAAALIAASGTAFAQGTGTMVQRDANQQQRIEQGLQSGQLTTREAARLEREQAGVERMESRALRDGTLSPAEAARINRAQNRASRDIYRQKHDAQTADPSSASSQRMQADVQRNLNQERRIQQGVQSGELTNREVSRLERGQARVDAAESPAAADGRVGAGEQQRIQRAENRQSARIYRQKHDAQTR